MADFTAVTHGFAPQLYMSELIDAVNERRLAAFCSGAIGLPLEIPSTAESVQSFQGGTVKPTHLLIQEMLEALAPHFVDHRQSGYTDTSETYPIAPFTVSTWRAAAGINSSGFRRATEWDEPSADPTFDYGLIQTGDIAGYWIWVDIIKGIQALKWTVAPALASVTNQQRNVVFKSAGQLGEIYPYEYGTFTDAVSNGDSMWASAGFVAYNTLYSRHRQTRLKVSRFGEPTNYYPEIAVIRDKYRLGGLDFRSPLSVSVDCLTRPNIAGHVFYDIEGFAENTWNLMETVQVASGSTVTMSGHSIASPSPTPFADAVTVPDISYGSDSSIAFILKWTFSRA